MTTTDEERWRDVVPGSQVLARTWVGGVAWGAAGGAVFTVLVLAVGVLGTLPSDVGDVVAGLMLTLVLAFCVGAPLGLVVGAVAAPEAAAVLLACRRRADRAPVLATLVTLAGLALAPSALLDGSGAGGIGLGLAICLVAAWPMYRTLERALRPRGAA